MAHTRRKHGLLLAALLLSLTAPVWAQTAEAPYDHPLFTGPAHEAPVARFDQDHLRLALRFDVAERRVFGDARFRLSPIGPDRDDVVPDSLLFFGAGLAIDSVLIGPDLAAMTTTSFRRGEADSLLIAFDSLYVPGTPFEVRIYYRAQPRRGLFFVQPSPQNPAQKRQIWTWQAPGTTRHWIPVLDGPSDMLTSELQITADTSWHVLSNGRRVEAINNENGTITTYFRQDRPHSLHRLMLVLGDHEVHQDDAAVATGEGPIPLTYRVYPEQGNDVARTFGQTPAVMQFFVGNLNVAFPWRSYHQVVLRQFPEDGQATAGITALPDPILLDERAALDENSDALMARMLARQWFGGLVTARSWTDIWLDEGFSAYLSTLFTEHHEGAEAFALTMLDHADRYLEEARIYRRPLVWDRWHDPSEMLDAHSAQKGAWVLHMLRRLLGDDLFWGAMEQYLTRHAFKLVDTDDLQRIVESVTREDFEPFFAQWVQSAGHPVLDVRYSYDADEGELAVVVTQRQEGYRVPDIFRADLTLEVHTLSDAVRFDMALVTDSQEFILPMSARPRFLLVDPDHEVLAEVHVDQPARAWVAQLRHAPDPVSRILAARALTAFADDPALLIGLGSALPEEPSAAVRKALAETMSQLPPSTATQRLLTRLMTDEEATVRAAALDALGAHQNVPEVHDLAFQAAQNDPSYTVQAAAVKTLARTASPMALDVVRSALITPSHREIIRRAAFEALALLDVPAREGVAFGLEYSAANQPAPVRIAAIGYLQTLAPDARAALNRMIALLEDDDVDVRRAAIERLGLVDSEPAREALLQHQTTEPEPMLQAALHRALNQHTASNQ